mmetsp:Transcript_16445/g.55512  ORF Transcript_16445/g.55512 Transcript_16445/m.55512 type:complete len:219 (+) Transcript_16445:128-784(+)
MPTTETETDLRSARPSLRLPKAKTRGTPHSLAASTISLTDSPSVSPSSMFGAKTTHLMFSARMPRFTSRRPKTRRRSFFALSGSCSLTRSWSSKSLPSSDVTSTSRTSSNGCAPTYSRGASPFGTFGVFRASAYLRGTFTRPTFVLYTFGASTAFATAPSVEAASAAGASEAGASSPWRRATTARPLSTMPSKTRTAFAASFFDAKTTRTHPARASPF